MMLSTTIRNEVTDTVITECHGEDFFILFDDEMTMAEAIALVENIPSRSQTKFVIFQADRAVGLYR